MINNTKSYTTEQADNAFAVNLKLEINTMMLCEVVKVDFANQRVDVKPVIKAVVRDDKSSKIITSFIGEDVRVSDIEMPALMGVPLCYARAGSAMITMPISVGDTGMLIISQRDISLWKEQGGTAEQSIGSGLFDINDGVFLPFVANKTNKDANYSQDRLEIRYNDDKISMDGAGSIVMNCNVAVSGTLTATSDCIGGGKSLKNHTHITMLGSNALLPAPTGMISTLSPS